MNARIRPAEYAARSALLPDDVSLWVRDDQPKLKVPGSALRHVLAATLGVATLVVLAGGWLPASLIAGAFAVAFIVLLPRAPRLVAAFCAGAALVIVAWSVFWSVGWSCASEVHGVLVEHDCGDPPLKESDR